MRTLLQRVSEAKVTVDAQMVGEIGKGLVVFLAIHGEDGHAEAERLAQKVLHLRIFADEQEKMNLSVLDVHGEILIVSQFTLYAETRKGHRPSYSKAAPPEQARRLYDAFVEICRKAGLPVATGIFQAHMKVYLVNDGPVTLLCEAES